MAKAAVKEKAAAMTELREVVAIHDLADADRAVTEAARLEIEMAALSADYNREINALSEEASAKVEPLRQKKVGLIEALTSWAREAAKTLKKKTLTFTCGTIAVREAKERVEFLEGSDVDSVVGAIKRRPTLRHLVLTKETVPLDDLKTIDPKLHEALGFRVVRGEPGVTINLDLKSFEELSQKSTRR